MLKLLMVLMAVSLVPAQTIQSRNADGNPNNQEMKIDFRVQNPNSEALSLSGKQIEYRFYRYG